MARDARAVMLHKYPCSKEQAFSDQKNTNSMPRLTQAQRDQAIGMSTMGASQRQIARTFNCSQTTIRRLLIRYQQTGQTQDRPRSGRPRVTTAAEDRYIRQIHLRNRFVTATSTAATALGHVISRRTTLRRLRSAGLRAYRPFRGMALTLLHRQRRLRWARTVRRWQRRDWARVLFTDESRFCLFRNDGRVRVFRRRGERLAPNCVREVHPFGGGGVMVWGGICGQIKTQLVILRGNLTGQRYIDEVLRPVVVPFLQQEPRGTILQHDNARPHTARIVRDYLENANVTVLPWPANSPDMNPIEHLWDHLDRLLRQLVPPPSNQQELEQALLNIWNGIPADVIRRLTTSMRRRVLACIDAQGGHTRY